MKLNGATCWQRALAMMLTLTMMMTGWLMPAAAQSVWDELQLHIHWTDENGHTQVVPAVPVPNAPERSYWVGMDPNAVGGTLALEAICPDPTWSFYFEDALGGHTTSFVWSEEMDAPDLDEIYAQMLLFSVDGVQTDAPIRLYVSSLPMPPEDVFTPFQVEVRVDYVTEDGAVLDSQYAQCWAGETNQVLASSMNTQGYELIGPELAEVWVDRSGIADPQQIVFTYRRIAEPEATEVSTPAPVEAVSVPVVYAHVGGETLEIREVVLAPGTHPVQAGQLEDYQLVSEDTVYITVYPDGSTDLSSIVFYYEEASPAQAVLPVYYYHENGSLLDLQDVTLDEGTHTIVPNSDVVAGMEIAGDAYVEVTVYADGSASAASVKFVFRDAYVAPTEFDVQVHYYHIDRGTLERKTIRLQPGTHVVTADSSKTADYVLLGENQVEVTVYEDGSTHPGSVEFYYQDPYVAPAEAVLNIVYQLADGTVVASDTMILESGTHTIVPDTTKISGYELDAAQAYTVVVDDSGAISPETVTFTCHQAAVTVTVHYQDNRGRDVAPVQYRTFNSDGYYIITAEPQGLAAEYELAPGMNTETGVTINGGVASQTDVYFYYQLKQASQEKATVTVGYFDTYGNEIARAQTVTLEPGVHQLPPDAALVPAGYELVTDAYITVEVYENGTFSPQEVAFYYRAPQSEEPQATVMVYYRDDRGNDAATPKTLLLQNGVHTIRAEDVTGYEIFPGTDTAVDVIVRNGVPSKNQVVFYYQKKAFSLPVNYYDTMGNQIAATQYVQVTAGQYNIQANPADLPEGYELMMESLLTVTVREDGTTDPEEIAFYYRAPEKKATIIVTYVDQEGRTITSPFTMELATGYHTIRADASRVPAGYDPQSAQPMQVYVSREGEAKPDQVILTFARLVYETPIPVGSTVYRYATVNDNSVAFRSEPTTAGGNKTIYKRVKLGAKVYVLQELYNNKNEVWAMVNVDGQTGYMKSDFLDIMSQTQSDAYAAGSTAVPTFTPAPTFTPVPTPTQAPVYTPDWEPTQPPVVLITPPPMETPTLEPLPTVTPVNTALPTATPYAGYALTARATALRTGISSSDRTIIQNLAANELVSVVNQVADPATGEMWAIVSTLNNQAGFVPYSALRPITDKEAEPYLLFWQEMNKTPDPTQLVTATPEPMQVEGYGVVLGDDVPFRQMASEYSRIIDNLDAGTIVYITGQTPADGQYWHSVNYEGYWGYIRADLVRMLTIAEEEDYLDRLNSTPTPEPVTTNLPFDQNGLSSYGYVDCTDGSSVNWREGASTGAKRIGELKRYAFCLVLGTEYVNGTTWYHVSYGDKTGYIHGDFFKQMTISELEGFLGSDEYLQGIANNSTKGDSSMDDAGLNGTGGIVSPEDQWINKNPDVYASFAPFNPIATIAPIQTTPTLEPLPGWVVTTAPTAAPTATPTFNPMPDVTYPTNDSGQGGNAIVWAVVIGLLLLAVGGVFALVQYQQNRRRIAMRAAQRRAQAARAQQMQQRPYARTTAQPRTGTYPNQQTIQVRRPAQGGDASQYAPYTRQYGQSSYRRPEQPSQDEAVRPGRRTAYRQAHQSAEQNGESNTFDA